MSNKMNLIQAVLAEFKDDDCEIQNCDELVTEAENVNDDQDADAEESSVEATRGLPSFIETVSCYERIEALAALFEKEFPVGKSFLDKEDARFQIQKISRANNILFETIRSNEKYVKKRYKYFGSYRTGRKDGEGNVT
ncbi:hypothetical protein HPULCUR_002199 [Helicostylum pulchrum]|uniref:Uncharacterized protein n=1 Tax=Helicostylum pulchrum TaxID=562976 RepID=A0ABP9XPT8_9FUNG